MFLDLNELYNEDVQSLQLEGELQIDSLDINGRDIRFTRPIDYEGNIYKVGRDKIIHLDISYAYLESCGRCLDRFEIEDKVILSGKLVDEEEIAHEAEDEDEDLIYLEDGKLNLDGKVTETIILALPMKPLCSKGCKGLCPECGINLNEQECNCKSEYVDPRFEKLKNLFSED